MGQQFIFSINKLYQVHFNINIHFKKTKKNIKTIKNNELTQTSSFTKQEVLKGKKVMSIVRWTLTLSIYFLYLYIVSSQAILKLFLAICPI